MRTFELKTGDESITLEWGVWAMHRFCELMGHRQEDGTTKALTLNEYLALYQPNEAGESQFTLIQVVRMVQAAAESFNEDMEVTERMAGRWIDTSGGIGPDSAASRFIRFTLGETQVDTTEKEKKSSD